MAKEIKYNVEAREMLKEGVDALSNAVKVTPTDSTYTPRKTSPSRVSRGSFR